MFSILNEIEDNSPFKTTSVVLASIGSSGSIYLLVAITGYLTFGDNVAGNIVAQCKLIGTILCYDPSSDENQIFLRSLQQSAKQQSLCLSCSHTLCKFILAALRLMQCSNGAQPRASSQNMPLSTALHLGRLS